MCLIFKETYLYFNYFIVYFFFSAQLTCAVFVFLSKNNINMRVFWGSTLPRNDWFILKRASRPFCLDHRYPYPKESN